MLQMTTSFATIKSSKAVIHFCCSTESKKKSDKLEKKNSASSKMDPLDELVFPFDLLPLLFSGCITSEQCPLASSKTTTTITAAIDLNEWRIVNH